MNLEEYRVARFWDQAFLATEMLFVLSKSPCNDGGLVPGFASDFIIFLPSLVGDRCVNSLLLGVVASGLVWRLSTA